MTKVKMLVALGMFCHLLVAQSDNNNYEDTFGKESHWPEFKDEHGSGSIINNKYVLKGVTAEGIVESCIYPYIDWNKTFQFEAKYSQSTRDFKNMSGLMWAKDGDDYNAFVIRANGWFIILTKKGNDVSIIKDWTKSPEINNIGNENHLKVRREIGNYRFFINEKEVFSAPEKKFRANDNGCGFFVEGQNQLEVSYFQFKQDVKIKLTKDGLQKKDRINLGKNVNGPYSEVAPMISPDGKTLYFTIANHPENKAVDDQDVWFSIMLADSSWTKAQNIGSPINNSGNNGVISVSPDNNTLYLSGLYKKDGSFGGAGFSFSEKTKNGWSIPEPIKIKNFYNQSEFQEACFGPDKKTMVFTAKRKDTFGQNDLYVSFRTGKNDWSEPLNLGSIVNTPLEESSPFLASDNKTLYFSTNGRPGYGDMDVFVTKRLDDSWTKWSEPLNMGPYINSIDFDAYFSLTAKGDYAYMVTGVSSFGQEDIIKIKMSEESKPEPVVVISGRLLDKKTNKPLSGEIVYELLPKGLEAGTATSDPNTGEFKIVLPYGKKYGFFSNLEGYFPQHENIDLSKIRKYTEMEMDIFLTPIELGEKVVLNNVFFQQSTPILLEDSYPELDRMVKMLKSKPKLEVELAGHTDNQGDPEKNQLLSEQRANAIKQYLISKGIKGDRITTIGYGQTQPVASNAREETRKLNRRVEFRVKKI